MTTEDGQLADLAFADPEVDGVDERHGVDRAESRGFSIRLGPGQEVGTWLSGNLRSFRVPTLEAGTRARGTRARTPWFAGHH